MWADDRPALEAVLALDLICLREADGGPLDAERHRERLAASIPKSQWAYMRRDGRLVAYGYLWPQRDDDWFVGGLAIHPDHRTAPVIAGLGGAMRELVARLGIKSLRSHALVGNAASRRLHQRLGFVVEKEDSRAIAFVAQGAALLARLPARSIPLRSALR